ncbi:hypothetical protein [Flavobacterium sp. TAB 87]|uniref:hypothetical protein n=1 Tax=Flavobacterium sp. TAB 87 TaxID=1729581 RepID=UPI00076DDC86|nr:hypothetical protein [Flavobacterium sp. TAB 87]KVV16362.1 hypothetical protein AP058_00114 [Flavobacterium sp. TAB 87]
MTFPDIIKEFFNSTKERLKTPISGAFLCSFVIYNWRPVLLLLFSNASIEDKIVIINHEYCSFWAIFFPALIALLYSLLIPKIMLSIDNDLSETKKSRVDNIYDVKSHTMIKKLKFAAQQFDLKNIETGNKQIDDFQEQIKNLKESNEQISNSHNNAVIQLNNELKNANSFSEKLLKELNSLKINDNEDQYIAVTLNNIPNEIKADISKIKYSKKSGIIDFSENNVSNNLIKYMVDVGIAKMNKNDNNMYITSKGINVLRHLKRLYSL